MIVSCIYISAPPANDFKIKQHEFEEEPEKSLVLNQIPCYLFMFNNLIHGYSGVL